MTLKELIKSPVVSWMAADGPEVDIVITSRIRLARNLAQLPFPHLMSEQKVAEKVWETINNALKNAPDLKLVSMNKLSDMERQMLLEKHLISPEHAEVVSPYRGIITNKTGSIAIMVNEEDHLRIQCLLSGLQLNQAYRYADDIDDLLEKELEYAFDDQWGYLTSCPTNVGTGMRASVMLHLPALTMTHQKGAVFNNIAQLGLTVRGLYGEGTEALGNFYQVSNQITLGQTEEDIINNLWTVTLHVVEQERNTRERLQSEMKHQLEDKVWRSYGLITHARVITSNEALALLSDVALGVDLKILPPIPRQIINELIVAIRPAHLQATGGRKMETTERDIIRAQVIKNTLNKTKLDRRDN
jgi:protein arginine kinase